MRKEGPFKKKRTPRLPKRKKKQSLRDLYLRLIPRLIAILSSNEFFKILGFDSQIPIIFLNIFIFSILNWVGTKARKDDVKYPKEPVDTSDYTHAQKAGHFYVLLANLISYCGVWWSTILASAILGDKIGELITLAPIKNKTLIRKCFHDFGALSGIPLGYFNTRVFRWYTGVTNTHTLKSMYTSNRETKIPLLLKIAPFAFASAGSYGIYSLFSSKHGFRKFSGLIFTLVNLIASAFNTEIKAQFVQDWLNNYIAETFGILSLIAGFSTELLFNAPDLYDIADGKKVFSGFPRSNCLSYLTYALIFMYFLTSGLQYGSAGSVVMSDAIDKEHIDDFNSSQKSLFIATFCFFFFGGVVNVISNVMRAYKKRDYKNYGTFNDDDADEEGYQLNINDEDEESQFKNSSRCFRCV